MEKSGTLYPQNPRDVPILKSGDQVLVNGELVTLGSTILVSRIVDVGTKEEPFEIEFKNDIKCVVFKKHS